MNTRSAVARPALGAVDAWQFLQVDPETGEASVYIFDGECARPAVGEELVERTSLRIAGEEAMAAAAQGRAVDVFDDLVERFAQNYERAYG